MSRYLNESEIAGMARAAVTTYEVAADWRAAYTAALEYAVDELGVRPSRSAVALAVKRAQVRWRARSMAARAAVSRPAC